jgi:hypothetical protein
MQMSKEMDLQFTKSIASQERKMQALERAHEQSMREQQAKILDLERAHEKSLREQQRKIMDLQSALASKHDQNQLNDLAAKVQELSLQQLNHSQNASITRATERDVKVLQHEVRNMHALKRDVEDMQQNMQDHVSRAESNARLRDSKHDSMHRDMQHIKSQINFFVDAHKSNTCREDIATINEKLKDMRKDMTLQELRLDKAHVELSKRTHT